VIEWLVLLVLLALAALYHKRRTAAIKRHYEEAPERQRQEYENKIRAQRIFDEWRAKELESLKAQYDKLLAERTEAIKKEYEALFEKWKQDAASDIQELWHRAEGPQTHRNAS
jgi:predicted Holliday junction resolvase-like endonuclease